MPVSATTAVRTTSAATNLSKLLQDIYMAKKFVPFLHKNLVVCQFGDEEDIPAHSGKNVRWLYHNALLTTGATTPSTALAEGSDPADSRATVVNFVEAALGTYGEFIEFTEELEDYSHPQTMSQFSELLAEQGARIFDTLVQTGVGGSNGLLSTTTSVDAGLAMTFNALRLATSKLRQNDALPHPKAPKGYAAIFSPEQADDMYGEGNPAWWQMKTAATPSPSIDPMHKPGQNGGPRPEVEGIANATIYVSTNVQPDSSSPVNDQALVLAANSFGISSFETDYMKPSVHLVEPIPSLASPLGRRGLYMWKGKFTTKIFDVKRVCLILSDQG